MTDENEKPTEEKIESNENNENNWWKSWYSAAKSKSEEVFDYLKQDLGEISTTVKSEATNFISNTKTAITDGIQITNPEWSSATSTVKDSVSSLLSQVSNVLSPQPIDGDEEAYIVENNKLSKIYLLSADSGTYIRDIEDHLSSRYTAWLDSLKHFEFNQLSNETLTKLLLTNSRLKENYEKLVPETVSHHDFWRRFLFRKALLEDAEAEKERKKSVEEKKVINSLEWEKESFGSHITLSEEEQGQLLEEYEKELSESSAKSTTSNENPKDGNASTQTSNSNESKSVSKASSAQSITDRESSSDDWEKDFDIEEMA